MNGARNLFRLLVAAYAAWNLVACDAQTATEVNARGGFTTETTQASSLLSVVGGPDGISNAKVLSLQMLAAESVSYFRWKAESVRENCKEKSGWSDPEVPADQVSIDVSEIPDGEVFLCFLPMFEKTDRFNPEIVAVMSWIKDTTPPVAQVTGQIGNSSTQTKLDVTVASEDSDIATYRHVVGLASAIDCADINDYGPATAFSTKITDDLAALPNGKLKFCLTVIDAAGNMQPLPYIELSWTSSITTPPSIVKVYAVSSGPFKAGDVMQIGVQYSAAVSVNGIPALSLEFTRPDSTTTTGTATYQSGSGTNTLIFGYTIPAGLNATSLSATGLAGTIGRAGSTSIGATSELPDPSGTNGIGGSGDMPVVDTTPPGNVTISSPANGTQLSSQVVTVSGSGAEAGATIFVRGFSDGTTTTGGTLLGSAVVTSGGEWSVVVAINAGATTWLRAIAQDAAGNTSVNMSAPVSVTFASTTGGGTTGGTSGTTGGSGSGAATTSTTTTTTTTTTSTSSGSTAGTNGTVTGSTTAATTTSGTTTSGTTTASGSTTSGPTTSGTTTSGTTTSGSTTGSTGSTVSSGDSSTGDATTGLELTSGGNDTTGDSSTATGDSTASATGDSTTGMTGDSTTGGVDTTGTADSTSGTADTTTTGDSTTGTTGESTTGDSTTGMTGDSTTGGVDTTGTADSTSGTADTTTTGDSTTAGVDTTGTADSTSGTADTTTTGDSTTGGVDTTGTADSTSGTADTTTTGDSTTGTTGESTTGDSTTGTTGDSTTGDPTSGGADTTGTADSSSGGGASGTTGCIYGTVYTKIDPNSWGGVTYCSTTTTVCQNTSGGSSTVCAASQTSGTTDGGGVGGGVGGGGGGGGGGGAICANGEVACGDGLGNWWCMVGNECPNPFPPENPDVCTITSEGPADPSGCRTTSVDCPDDGQDQDITMCPAPTPTPTPDPSVESTPDPSLQPSQDSPEPTVGFGD